MSSGTFHRAQIKIVLQNSSFCKLPPTLRSACGGRSSCVVRISLSRSSKYLHVHWNGATSDSNAIELPQRLVSTCGYSSLIKESSEYDVCILTEVGTAADVFLRPVRNSDWEIVSTQAGYVENNMLKEHSILAIDQIVTVRVGDSMSANLLVTDIKMSTNAPAETAGTVARINNTTSLIIAPFQEVKAKEQSSGAVDSVDLATIDYESVSHLQRLHVLPHQYCATDSSFQVAANHSSPTCADAGDGIPVPLDDSYLQQFLTGDNDQDHPDSRADNMSAPLRHAEHGSSGCIVHPTFFITCFDASLSRKLTPAQWEVVATRLTAAPVFACIENCDDHTAQGESKTEGAPEKRIQLTPHAVVQVTMNIHVRPGCCILPAEVRRGMHLRDYAAVRLYVVSSLLGGTALPQRISLKRIFWRIDGGEDDLTSGVHDTEDVKSQLLRCIERAHSARQPYILHDKQVISLSRPRCVSGEKASQTEAAGDQGPERIMLETSDYFVSLVAGRTFARKGLPGCVVLYSGTAPAILSACLAALEVQGVTQAPSGTPTPQSDYPDPIIAPLVCDIDVDMLPAALQKPSTRRQLGAADSKDSELPAEDRAEVTAAIFHRTLRAVLRSALPVLLPSAALDCLSQGVAPHCAALLVGANGTGRTTLLMEIGELFHKNLRTQTHASYLDAAELKNKPLDIVLTKLTEVFTAAKAYPTGILLIDNLDVLCPSAKENGTGTLRDERSGIVSLHLELLLRALHEEGTKRYQRAARFFQGGQTENADTPFATEQAVQTLTEHAVYVLASAASQASIAPGLLKLTAFRSAFPIETLSEKAKLSALRSALSNLDATLNPLSAPQADVLSSAMLGYCLHDINCIAKRVCAQALRRLVASEYDPDAQARGGNDEEFSLVAEFDDVREAIALHVSVSSSGGTGTSASTAALSVSLEDVAGYGRAKKQIVDTLRTPLVFARLYEKSPIKLPRSVLLYGPPGCGKTLLAQAAGREFGRGYIAVRGPELLNKYIGASEKAVRELFQRARDSGRPCLIFFDEFESLAPRRGKDNTGVTDRIVNQLLTFIDGVESNMTGGGAGSDVDGEPSIGANKAQIFIIAATSRPDLVDPALLRPGRIERHIYVGLPNAEDCADILRRSLRSLVATPTEAAALENAVALMVAHEKARTFSPADWKAVVNTAYLSATHAYIEAQLESSVLAAGTVDHAVRVTEEHLLQAFHATRASITTSDLQHLSGIYKKFGKESKPQEKKNGAPAPAAILDADLKLSYA